jgi:hypothetical protein
MIFCVVPQALADELYDKLADYYKDDPNVKVIIDRRDGPDRRKMLGTADKPDERREVRDRRHRRAMGTFPPIEPPK